jgi:hypothetical protein
MMMNSNIKTQKQKFLFFITTMAFIISCYRVNGPGITPIYLNFPDSKSYDALIMTDDEIVVLVEDTHYVLLAYGKENDNDLYYFSLAEDPNCFKTRYYAYETLPDGKLQVWKNCGHRGNGTDTYLMAYDWETAELEELVKSLPLGSSGASWNPEQTQAIAYLDSKFATKTLYWIYSNSYEALDLEIKDGERSWNLKDDFPAFDASDKGESGTTGRASWSSNGKQIAFFASPNAIGKTGFDRFGVEYYLYLMNPENLKYEVVADNIYSPFVLAWSPDSTYIAFVGKRGFLKTNGIWLYSTKTNTVTNISEGTYTSIVWRSNSSVVAIECEDFDVCNQVVEFDISSILDE